VDVNEKEKEREKHRKAQLGQSTEDVSANESSQESDDKRKSSGKKTDTKNKKSKAKNEKESNKSRQKNKRGSESENEAEQSENEEEQTEEEDDKKKKKKSGKKDTKKSQKTSKTEEKEKTKEKTPQPAAKNVVNQTPDLLDFWNFGGENGKTEEKEAPTSDPVIDLLHNTSGNGNDSEEKKIENKEMANTQPIVSEDKSSKVIQEPLVTTTKSEQSHNMNANIFDDVIAETMPFHSGLQSNSLWGTSTENK